jgi:hypothetical protein
MSGNDGGGGGSKSVFSIKKKIIQQVPVFTKEQMEQREQIFQEQEKRREEQEKINQERAQEKIKIDRFNMFKTNIEAGMQNVVLANYHEDYICTDSVQTLIPKLVSLIREGNYQIAMEQLERCIFARTHQRNTLPEEERDVGHQQMIDSLNFLKTNLQNIHPTEYSTIIINANNSVTSEVRRRENQGFQGIMQNIGNMSSEAQRKLFQHQYEGREMNEDTNQIRRHANQIRGNSNDNITRDRERRTAQLDNRRQNAKSNRLNTMRKIGGRKTKKHRKRHSKKYRR